MVAFNKSVHADLGHGYVTTDSIMQHKNEIASNINGSGSKCFLALIVSDNKSKSPETILIKTAWNPTVLFLEELFKYALPI